MPPLPPAGAIGISRHDPWRQSSPKTPSSNANSRLAEETRWRRGGDSIWTNPKNPKKPENPEVTVSQDSQKSRIFDIIERILAQIPAQYEG